MQLKRKKNTRIPQRPLHTSRQAGFGLQTALFFFSSPFYLCGFSIQQVLGYLDSHPLFGSHCLEKDDTVGCNHCGTAVEVKVVHLSFMGIVSGHASSSQIDVLCGWVGIKLCGPREGYFHPFPPPSILEAFPQEMEGKPVYRGGDTHCHLWVKITEFLRILDSRTELQLQETTPNSVQFGDPTKRNSVRSTFLGI